jgi:hypothetical protein
MGWKGQEGDFFAHTCVNLKYYCGIGGEFGIDGIA